MPIDVKKVTESYRVVDVPVTALNGNGLTEETLHIKHRIISPARLRDLEGLRAEENGAPAKMDMIRELAALLIDIDMTEDGRSVEPNEEFLDRLDFSFLKAVYEAIWESTFQKKATSQNSKPS